MLMGSATRPIVGVVRSLRGLECVSVPRPLCQVSIQGSFRTRTMKGDMRLGGDRTVELEAPQEALNHKWWRGAQRSGFRDLADAHESTRRTRCQVGNPESDADALKKRQGQPMVWRRTLSDCSHVHRRNDGIPLACAHHGRPLAPD